jgi:poly(3-hydroxybutyrate) depolymerase
MSREEIGTIYVQHAGYNQLAEVNNIIILYPQTRISEGNRNSCWDWWGYTTAAYATQLGLQMKTVKAMVDRLTGAN